MKKLYIFTVLAILCILGGVAFPSTASAQTNLDINDIKNKERYNQTNTFDYNKHSTNNKSSYFMDSRNSNLVDNGADGDNGANGSAGHSGEKGLNGISGYNTVENIKSHTLTKKLYITENLNQLYL